MTFDEIMCCLSGEDQKTVRDMMAYYEDIDRQTQSFSMQTGLRCKKGCGSCCENPEIETTVAEVLPLAVHWWASGDTDRWNFSKGVCAFYEPDPVLPGHGRCGIYAFRPGLCRLFGFSARKDKYGKSTFMTCRIIKDEHSHACDRTQEQLQTGSASAPLLTHHSFFVSNIDPVHGSKLLPINVAISRAIEKVGYRIHKNLNRCCTDPGRRCIV